MKKIEIYTDGACSGNPGPGGYGVILSYNGAKRELSAGFRLTTNNRMELLAAISALEALKEPCEATLYSDSKYLTDAVNKRWLSGWKKKGWTRGKNEPLLNKDLWRRLDALLETHAVTFVWVKGHADNPGNDRCDELARGAVLADGLGEDDGYIQN